MKRYALIISCEEYSNASTISFCHADAELLRETLCNYCDYDDDNIHCIIEYPGCDETPSRIYDILRETIEKTEENDSILFYFAGHGAKEGEHGYLLLADSKSSDYASTALNLRYINQIMRESKRNSFLILDACHSGIEARNGLNLYVDKIEEDKSCITMASCSSNQESNPYGEKEQGVFTYYLCEAIKSIPINMPVYVQELHLKVCNLVTNWAKQNYKNQTPTLLGNIVGDTFLARRNSMTSEDTFSSDTIFDFGEALIYLETEFFSRCQIANYHYSIWDTESVMFNYSVAREICWSLISYNHNLVDDWEEAINMLQYFSRYLEDGKIVRLPISEQKEIVKQITDFVESVPDYYWKD